jgi:hypothetical protein
MRHPLGVGLVVALAAICAGEDKDRKASEPRVVEKATEAQLKELWEPLKALEGEWEVEDEDGKRMLALTVKVTSEGSAILETIFPGTKMEMLNVLTMDGGSVLLTHYCHAGNQPRMRATSGKDGTFEFAPEGCGNLCSKDEGFMGSHTRTIKDADHMDQTWNWHEAGESKPAVSLKFERKKK